MRLQRGLLLTLVLLIGSSLLGCDPDNPTTKAERERNFVEPRIAALKPILDLDRREMRFGEFAQSVPVNHATIPALIRALADEDDTVRWFAAKGLARAGPEATEIVPALTNAFKDPDVYVRFEAMGAIARWKQESKGDARAAVPALVALSKEHHQSRRWENVSFHARSTLQALGADAKAAVPVLIEELRDRAPPRPLGHWLGA